MKMLLVARLTTRYQLLATISSKPVAPIRHPPADVRDRNRRNQRPPDRQSEIGQQAQQNETTPENLPFH